MAQFAANKPAIAKSKTAAKKSKAKVKRGVYARTMPVKRTVRAKAMTDPTADMLREAHENVAGLFEIGLVDKQTMSEFDEMCVPKVRELAAPDIKALREELKVSQSVLAVYLNTTKSTISQWEQGDKRPNGIAQRLLNIIRDKGLEVIV